MYYEIPNHYLRYWAEEKLTELRNVARQQGMARRAARALALPAWLRGPALLLERASVANGRRLQGVAS